MLYRKSQVSDRWLRAPLQAPTALHQPLSYISRSHIADVFASQENGRKDISVCFTGHRAIPPQELPALTEPGAESTVSARVSGFYLRRRAGI